MSTTTSHYNVVDYIYWFCTLYVLVNILSFLWIIFNQYIVPRLKTPEDYTKYGRWAVLTGCTDGIGKGFAKGLASKGVDICLISRNEEKLKNTAKEIEESYNVKTKYIVADFTDTTVYKHIRESLAETDIGILVNSVGMMEDKLEPFINFKEQLIKDYHNVNLLSLTMMTSIVLPCMKRKNCGLIINMSSAGGELLLPGLSLYCGCKAFITMFGTSLSYEVNEYNIHVVTFVGGFVQTKLLLRFPGVFEFFNLFGPFGVLTIPEFIKQALITISSGCYKTCGYVGYDIFLELCKVSPIWLRTYILWYIRNKAYKKK